MKDKCISAVSEAIGRDLTKAEAQKIEGKLLEKMRFIASQDPKAFQAMTPAQRLNYAADEAAQDLVKEAEQEKKRVVLAIEKSDALDEYIGEMQDKGINSLSALERKLVPAYDDKSDTTSSYTLAGSIRANAVRQLKDTFEAVNPRFWGLFEDKEGIKQLTRAIFGEQTGDAIVDKGAKAWLEVTEALRNQFNEAGGKIGKLENWAIPQHHSQLKVLKADKKQWVADVFPLLNRRKYFDDAGFPMTDKAIMELLDNAWLSIATGGVNQMTPSGAQGQSMLANRRAHHREIHFKDADSYLAYQEKYGEQSLWGIMQGHVDGLSKEIAALETFGPNPDATFKLFLEKSFQSSVLRDPANTAKHEQSAKELQGLFDYVSGKSQPVVNKHLAQGFDTLRNVQIAAKLGSAVVTSITDYGTLSLTAGINRLPAMQLFLNHLDALNPLNKEEENLAHRAGLGIDTLINGINRWGQDELGPTFSSKTASTVMRASGMEALDSARRRSFGVTMMSSIGELVKKYTNLADLAEDDHRILLSKGITDTNWNVWRMAKQENWGRGNGILTPESIQSISDAELQPLVDAANAEIDAKKAEKIANIESMSAMTPEKREQSIQEWETLYDNMKNGSADKIRRDAILKLLSTVLEETDMAVIRPGPKEKFITGGNTVRGTWKGELTRSFFLFKSFPIAMIYRHWGRAMGMDTAGGKALYIAKLMAATTVLGAVTQSVNDLLNGKNPRNYDVTDPKKSWKNWLGAMLKGGSLGIYGDFLFSEATQHSKNGMLGTLEGPVFGLAEEAINLTQGNLIQMAKGEETNFGAEATRFIKGNLPGANLWYAKAALDHLVFQNIQEYYSPGYLSRMKTRAKNEFGQTFYWDPGTGLDRIKTPDLGKAVGK